MKYSKLIGMSLLVLFVQGACDKSFLDQRPDLSQVLPATLQDCQALLDDYNRMNKRYPDRGEAAADNYFVSDAIYSNFVGEERFNYSWDPKGEHVYQWLYPYQVVYNANLVLETLGKISSDESGYKAIRGSALFYRAFAFYHLAQLFCKPYTAATAATDLGIPLRLSPDISEVSTRGTVQQVYDRITADLTEAVSSLPVDVKIKSRPSKTAAFAMLARAYLSMEDYPKAGKMADEALKLQSTLIDYNASSFPATATTVTSNPNTASFLRFNVEVIFQAVTNLGILSQNNAQIHPELYSSYEASDRRKSVFFAPGMQWGEPNGTTVFRGNYDGSLTADLFMGLATNEMYLIRAECYARAGSTQLAMDDLNSLLAKRMLPPYVSRTATNANNALLQVLAERRKELIFRTLRWTDLRRLNKDPQFAKVLRRDQNNIGETPLQPNDLRYTFLIPTVEVINLSGMPQNPR